MDRPPLQGTMLNEFAGQYSDVDQDDCPRGTMYKQLNLHSIVQGQLTTRGGLKEIATDTLE